MKRRVTHLLTLIGAALVAVSGVALAQEAIECTGGLCVGTFNWDTMIGTARIDDMRGREGDDWLEGRARGDLLRGQADNDKLFGQEGPDELSGSDGSDDLSGGTGDDTLNGSYGNDLYTFGRDWGDDTITAGEISGISDTLDFRLGSATSVVVDLEVSDVAPEASSGENTLNILTANPFATHVIIEEVLGSNGDDSIYGNSVSNHLTGRDGPDEIHGRGGDDVIYGSQDNDVIYGDLGTDTVYGDNPNNLGITGDDEIWVADDGSEDTVNCGPGTDAAYVDKEIVGGNLIPTDNTSGCEFLLGPP